MAYSKVILNGTTLIDLTQKTVTAANMLNGITALKNDGTDITGTYVPASTQTKTATPSTSQQTISPDPGFLLSSVTVNAMPSGTAGTPSATKGSVSNHSVTVTPSVTNTTGYITGGTLTGTPASVSAAELVSGTLSITDNGTGIDVTNYASVDVDVSGGGGGGISISPYFVRVAKTMPTMSDWTVTAVKAATDMQGNMYLTSETQDCGGGLSVTFTDLALVDGYVYITLCGHTDNPMGIYGLDTYNPQTYFDTINGSDRLFMIQPTENTGIDFM